MPDETRIPADLVPDSRRMLVLHRDEPAPPVVVLGAVLHVEAPAARGKGNLNAHAAPNLGVLTISTAFTVPDDASAYSGSAGAPANP